MVGSDITDWSTDDFREHIAGKLQEHADRDASHARPRS